MSIKATKVNKAGNWVLLQNNTGVTAMHMQLLHNDEVIIFERTDVGSSNLSLPQGLCVNYDPLQNRNKLDCTAHSISYDVVSNTVRPLNVQTNTWCSSGSVDTNGTLIQTGGFYGGVRRIRAFTPCNDDDKCDWVMQNVYLTERRWYASNQLLPDGRIIIVGGRRALSYEFFPKNAVTWKSYYMSFLKETRDPFEENNLYPFLHLLPDGNLFVFANNKSILFDYKTNRILRFFPVMPGGFKRNYPSTGSSVLLPLWPKGFALPDAEVFICGGSPAGAFNLSDRYKVFVSATKTCGRLRVTDPHPKWVMENMPMPRVMSDMLLLPSGDVIIINGASKGTAGWDNAVNAVLHPVLYKPYEPDPKSRFVVLNPSKTPRMYHSAATLLRDGRILVGGSNPHAMYNFTGKYPTDLSLEAFYPPYLSQHFATLRPSILTVVPVVSLGEIFPITFFLSMQSVRPAILVTLISPSFSTHSTGMNQRMLVLEIVSLENLSAFGHSVTVRGPITATVAPPGYYMLFIVHRGIPSEGVWVKFL